MHHVPSGPVLPCGVRVPDAMPWRIHVRPWLRGTGTLPRGLLLPTWLSRGDAVHAAVLLQRRRGGAVGGVPGHQVLPPGYRSAAALPSRVVLPS